MIITTSFKHEEVLGLQFGYAPIGKPKQFVHIYYVDGLLIDTGQYNMRKTILESTKDLAVGQMFITHYHEDHTGNIRELQEQHQCEVYAPEMTCQIMKAPPKISLIQKIAFGQREAYSKLTPVKDVIKTKNYQFEVIPIPGHAPDMVALYEPHKKWLFSADLYINSYIGYFLSDESILAQISSTRKILQLEFDTLFCAHNPQLAHGKRQLAKKLHFLESFFDQVSSLYSKGYTAKQIFQKLHLQEDHLVKFLSGGKLSKLNMVHAVIRDLKKS